MSKANGRAQAQFHPVANIFPMDDESLDELAADIKANGLLYPIEFCDGKIIDGRRRWMACRIAGVTADEVEVSPADPVSYVLSLNLHRRHLTPSQKSMVGARARAREMTAKDSERRMKAGTKIDPVENLPQGKTRDIVAKAVGVSGKSIDFATTVLEKGSKQLQRAVDAGRVPVSKAAAIAKAVPKNEQMKALKANPFDVVVHRPERECEIPDSAIVSSHYTCPTCGQKWPKGRPIHGKGK
jgi:hypothetical protein